MLHMHMFVICFFVSFTVNLTTPGSVGKPWLPCLIETFISHEAIVKSGLTTTSIIVVNIFLYPVKDLLSRLKEGHFLHHFVSVVYDVLTTEWRILADSSSGSVPLAAIDVISNPSSGISRLPHSSCKALFSILCQCLCYSRYCMDHSWFALATCG